MKIYLRDQSDNFERHLITLLDEPVMAYNKQRLRMNVSSIDLPIDSDLKNINLDFFFDYSIFPPHVMTFMTQWAVERRAMKPGDTILQ